MSEDNIMDMIMDTEEVVDDTPDNYSQQDEANARRSASEILRQNKLKEQAGESVKVVKSFKEMQENYLKEITALRTELENMKNDVKSVSSTTDTLATQRLTESIINDEKALSEDEILAPYYDQKRVRNRFLQELAGDPNKHIKPKELTPYQALAIERFYEVCEENKKLKERQDKIVRRQSLPFDTEVNPYGKKEDWLANVHNPDEARKEALRIARDMDGL